MFGRPVPQWQRRGRMKAVIALIAAAMVLALFDPMAMAADGETAQQANPPARSKKEAVLDWLLDHTSLFTATREDFEKLHDKDTYSWLDKEMTRARFNPDRVKIKLRGAESGETIISFKAGKIAGVLISVMNKGDDGYIKEIPFQKAITSARAMLKAVAKTAESPRKKNETVSKAEGFVWSTKQAMYMLEYLWVPEEARDGYITYAHGEFVRIRILPPQVLLGVQKNTLRVDVSRPTLAKRVRREGSKVTVEGLPMVDQGSKGYCAVASFERVMRYYGSEVDMHDLADLANSSGLGTSPSGMKDAVHKMAVRSGLRTREPIFLEGKQFTSMMNAYNREAKKAALEIVERPSGLIGLYREMDPDVFKEMRRKDPGYAKFSSEVARSIDAGIPLMWALQLGMFWEEGLEDSYEANREGPDSKGPEVAPDKPELTAGESEAKRPKRPPEYMAGSHMRLIIGYDPKARLIYYTDSWGPGHEMKKMDLAEAWAVTMALFVLEP